MWRVVFVGIMEHFINLQGQYKFGNVQNLRNAFSKLTDIFNAVYSRCCHVNDIFT